MSHIPCSSHSSSLHAFHQSAVWFFSHPEHRTKINLVNELTVCVIDQQLSTISVVSGGFTSIHYELIISFSLLLSRQTCTDSSISISDLRPIVSSMSALYPSVDAIIWRYHSQGKANNLRLFPVTIVCPFYCCSRQVIYCYFVLGSTINRRKKKEPHFFHTYGPKFVDIVEQNALTIFYA